MRLLPLLCVVLATVLVPGERASAQEYPNHPIRLISPFEAGGGVDLIARFVAQHLGQELGKSVIVENRPGAGGVVGTQVAVGAAPDGYTLLLASRSPIVIAPLLIPSLSYDPTKDLEPIMLVADVPTLLVVQPASPIRTVADLISTAKAAPGKLTFGSSGVGGSAYLAGQLIDSMANVDMLHVPYKGTAPAIVAVLSGEVTMTFADVLAGLHYVQSGQLRAVAVTSSKRTPALPDVPTIAEVLPGYAAGVWYGIFAPKNTPRAVVTKLNQALTKMLQQPDVIRSLADQNVTIIGGTPGDLSKFMREETDRWGKIIRSSGMKPE